MGFRLFLVYIFQRNLKKVSWFLLIFLVGVYFYAQLLSRPDGKLHVRFLDVGQGDSIFITTAAGSRIIIDGGLGDGVLSLVNQFMPWGDRKIELMLLTHPHADHIGGLIGVLRNYEVKNIIYEPEAYSSQTYERFLIAVKDEEKTGARILNVKTGDIVKIGSLELKIVWDSKGRTLGTQSDPVFIGSDPKSTRSDPSHPSNSNVNNESIVTELSYGDFEVFLPGDAQGAEANEIVASGAQILPVEVYKVSHHGSRNGLNPDVVKQLSPQLSVIQVGKNNSYGHPHSETLNLLAGLKSVIKRTDLDGTIEIVSDGQSWSIR